MFFHPNDGTCAYPTPSDCNTDILWERINDLEIQVERQLAQISEQNRTIMRLSSTVRPDPNIIRTETVVNQDIMNSMGRINPVEHYQRMNEESLMTYLREHNYFNHEMYSDYGGETRIRTSLRILDNPN
jgi:hypothetical protein